MKTFTEQLVARADIEIFEEIRRAVELLSEIDLGSDDRGQAVVLSCHVLARAIARVFGLRYVDGWVRPNYEHSWVLSPAGHIIDVYPVAVIGGPILMENRSGHSPASHIYDTSDRHKLYRGDFSRPWFRRSVRRVSVELQKIKAS